MQVKVVIADDHRVFADGLAALLADRYDVVGIASTGRELLSMVEGKRPDVAITDISMPLMNGLEALRELKKLPYSPKIIVLSMHTDVSIAIEAFRSGASAFLVKTTSGEKVREAFEAVLNGRSYVSPNFGGDLLNMLIEAARHPNPDSGYKLTRRQREVLQLVAEGKTMKQVATMLNISTRTAESYKYELMRTIGIHTNAELVQHAIRLGLITVSPLDPAV
jgi:DNA-binding NarL/FixJ family response regulator